MAEKKNISLKKFNIKKFTKIKNFSCVISASRRSGKSELIKHIINENDFNNLFDYIVIFCSTYDTMEEYQNIIKGDLFFYEYNENVIDNLILLSEKYKKKNKEKSFLIIFDDMITDVNKLNKNIISLFTKGRHYNISIIFSTQKLSSLSTSIRNNCDFFIFGLNKNNKEVFFIIDEYLLGLANEEERKNIDDKIFYRELVNKYTIDYNFIILDYTNNKTNDFLKTCYYYKS